MISTTHGLSGPKERRQVEEGLLCVMIQAIVLPLLTGQMLMIRRPCSKENSCYFLSSDDTMSQSSP